MTGKLYMISDLLALFLNLDYYFISSWGRKRGEFSLREHWASNASNWHIQF